jgi:hypothetical protein
MKCLMKSLFKQKLRNILDDRDFFPTSRFIASLVKLRLTCYNRLMASIRSLRWQVLVCLLLCLIGIAALIPANALASGNIEPVSASTLSSQDYSLVPIMPAYTDNSLGIRTLSEHPARRGLASRDSVPLTGLCNFSTLSHQQNSCPVYFTISIELYFSPIFLVVDIPPPSVLA